MAEIGVLRQKLQSLANPTLAENYKRYLKSPYAFYGIRVPILRKIAKEEVKSGNLNIYDAYNLFEELWSSGNHDEMNLAIFIIQNFKKKFCVILTNNFANKNYSNHAKMLRKYIAK